MERLLIESKLPDYLEHDIQVLVDRLDGKNSEPIDCLECEIIGSTNMALMSKAITKSQAELIRSYYVGGGYLYGVD